MLLNAIIHALIGMFVSFMGSIPFSSINLSVIQVSISKSFRAAIDFIWGAVLAEIVYAFIAIKLTKLLVNNIQFNLTIEIVASVVLTGLSIFYLRKKVHSEEHATEQKDKLNSFQKGLLMGFINPMAIPFWITYTTYFELNKFIDLDVTNTVFYIIGIAIGSFGLLTVFAKLAGRIAQKIDISERLINRIIGFALAAMACYQIGHVLYTTTKV